MSFNLPSAEYLMTDNAGSNRGSFDGGYSLGLKTAGNLPTTTRGTQVTNNGASRGIYFGLGSQTSTSSEDASTETKVLLTSVQFNAPNRIQVNTLVNRGVVARLVSGAGASNIREYRIGGNDTPFASSQAGPVTICLDLSAGGEDDSAGTYDNSNVTGWGYGTNKINISGTSSNQNYFQRVFILDTEKGGARLPYFDGASNFDDALLLVQGTDYTNKIGSWLTKSGSSFFVPIPFSFGDGSSAINFDDQGVSVVSPANNASGQENFRLTDNAMRVYLNTRDNAADSVTLSGSYVWGTAAPWDFSQSNNGTATLSGNFTGMGEFTLGSSVAASGVFSLAAGSDFVVQGANIDNATINGDCRIESVPVTTITGVTVKDTLNFDTAGTYTLNGCDVNEVTNSSGGSVVINLTGGTTIGTNTGPDITLETSSTFTLTGLQPNTEVRVFEAGTTNEVAGVENVTGTFTDTLNVSLVDVAIVSLGFLNIRLEGVDTSTDVTLPIQQQIDRQYFNP